jgi:hypothetical protein
MMAAALFLALRDGRLRPALLESDPPLHPAGKDMR